ncbi:SDR family NAD(P)-dependent oxidoreductase [Paenibacillus shirakamiensis]|nr:SDR family NAD(P)-dependent oxidoreductase [Paenibacillus shirakamiensis]
MIFGQNFDSQQGYNEVAEHLTQVFEQVLGLEQEELLEQPSLKELGISSMNLVELLEAINTRFELTLPTSILMECHDMHALTQLILSQVVEKAQNTKTERNPLLEHDFQTILPEQSDMSGEEIAVVGLSCRSAGASGQEEFWNLIAEGRDCTRPLENPAWVDFLKSNSSSYVPIRYGAMDDIDLFDSLFFSISPKEAEAMDPAQRIVLEECYRALEDAGYVPRGQKVGTFMGTMGYAAAQDYSHLAMLGTDTSILAARIAYYLNLKGPALAINTACSSSLVAIDMACEKLRSSEIDMAIAGGITIYTHPGAFLFMNNASMLSPTGECRPFDEAANGIVVGDGVGIVILKRLSDAVKDGDHIYGVLRGSGMNQDGQTSGITVPSFMAQSQLQTSIYERFDIDVEDIQYIEAHGTATKLGDPVEVHALTHTFRSSTAKTKYCGLGSIKANIGHTTAAAGVLSLIKVLLSMKHQMMPPSIHFDTANEHMKLDESPFFVNTTLNHWPYNGKGTRLAAVSSFGFSGTNAHLVVEEFVGARSPLTQPDSSPIHGLFLLSAASQTGLISYAKSILNYVLSHPEVDFNEVLYTYQTARELFPYRIAVIVENKEQWIQDLTLYLNGKIRSSHTVIEGDRRDKKHSINKTDEENTHVAELLDRKDYMTIAELWTGGNEIPWKDVYKKGTYHRLSALPTHPFIKERFALPKITSNPSPIKHIHPLLHDNISTWSQMRFVSIFTGEESFLKDHQVLGEKVLPGSAFLEMAIAAVKHSMEPDGLMEAMRMEHVRWTRPVVVGHNSVEIRTYLTATGKEIKFEMCSGATDQMIHAQGHIILQPALSPRHLNINDIKMQCQKGYLSSDECYRYFEDMNIEYGASHRGLREIYVGDQQVLAYVELPESLWNQGEGITLHPGLIDSALQASIGLLQSGPSLRTLVPFAIDSINIIGEGSPSIWAWIQPVASEGEHVALDIDLCDSTGSVWLQFRGFAVREISHNVSKISFHEDAFTPAPRPVTRLLEPIWNFDEALSAKEGNMPSPSPSWDVHLVILCEMDITSAECKPLCEAHDELSATVWLELSSTKIHLNERYEEYALTLLDKIQRIIEDTSTTSACIQLVLPHAKEQHVFSGLVGLLQTASLEHPKISWQCIELNHRASANTIALILRENVYLPRYTHIRYQDGKPYRVEWREIQEFEAIDLTANGSLWKDQGVYLITGGLGGLGKLLALHAAQSTSTVILILSGRSSLDDQDTEFLHSLQALGAKVDYQQSDITDRESTALLIQHIEARWGNIDGIVHTAGIIQDQFILKKHRDAFLRVLQPKVTGLLHLDETTCHHQLEFFVLFSSIAGATGNVGQADYSVANGFMDKYARYRNELVLEGKRKGHCISINWPLWEEGGMRITTSQQDTLKENMGFVPLRTDEAMSLLIRSVQSGRDQLMIVHGDPNFSEQMLVRTDADHYKSPSIILILKQGVSKIAGIPVDRIDTDTHWSEYGLDVVHLNAFAEHIGHTLDIPLSVANVMEYSTLNQLADLITTNIPLDNRSLQTEDSSIQAQDLSLQAHDFSVQEKDTSTQEQAVLYFKKILSTAIQLPAHRIDAEAPLEKYGIDSIMAMSMTDELEKEFGGLSKTLFFEYRTIRELTEYFLASHSKRLLQILGPLVPENVTQNKLYHSIPQLNTELTHDNPVPKLVPVTDRSVPSTSLDIAIIGVAGRYPGANNIREFWENLRQGIDSITEIPAERWDYSLYFDEDRNKLGTTYSKWGGFIDGVDEFDPLFFGISPLEAEVMDPQERLFLQCVYATLEDAGYTRESIGWNRRSGKRNAIGVYAGVMYEEYQLYGAQEQIQGRPIAFSGSPSSIANRVSYWFDFKGPSMAIDTMCSSSLTAIHLACHSIIRGECSLAIAGGVNVSIHPNKYLMLAQGKFISSKGRCESFGEGGDGYVPGEGVGAVLLKSLAAAEADGDHIYGVLKGSAINHGGKTNGYSVPSPQAQGEIIERAFEEAEIDIRTVGYIEAHGTGTSLGDPIEMNGLIRAFSKHASDTQFCAIGSAKSNIGHCESAAGIAGLTKVILQLKHRQIAPSLHSSVLNPHIDFKSSPFQVQQELTEWRRPRMAEKNGREEYPCRAGISSFGAGGSNAHLVMEEYIPKHSTYEKETSIPLLLLLSAKNKERLREKVKDLLSIIRDELLTDSSIHSMIYTLQVGREFMEERLAMKVRTIEEVVSKLNAYLQDEDIEGVYQGQCSRQSGTLAFFAVDEDLKMAMDTWIIKGKYEKLLDLWVQGVHVDWVKLYKDNPPKKMSLPTYPFAKDRYWIPTIPVLNGELNKERPLTDTIRTVEYRLHPLLHENTSNFFEQRFSSLFHGNEFFLSDHRVMNKPTLPGAVYLEMARAAYLHSCDRAENEDVIMILQNVSWTRPFIHDEISAQIHIGLQPEAEDKVSFHIYSDSSLPAGELFEYSQGSIQIAQKEVSSPWDLIQIRADCRGRELHGAECYEIFNTLGINYGDTHRGLQKMYVGAGQVLTQLQLPASIRHTQDQFLLHPSLLDAAFQSCIGMMWQEEGVVEPTQSISGATLRIPFSMKELKVFGSLPSDVWAYIRWSKESGSQDRVQKMDIDLCDAEGRVKIQIKEFSTRILDEDLFSIEEPIPELQGLRSFSPIWDVSSIPYGAIAPTANQPVLIIGEDTRSVEALRVELPRAKLLQFQAEHTMDDMVRELRLYERVEHIFWIAPAADSHENKGMIQGQQQGVMQLFNLVKALFILDYGKAKLGWTIVTEQTQAVHDAEQIQPDHASVHGFVGSLAKEYPHWSIRMVDVEAGQSWPISDILSIPPDAQGNAWVYRQHEWFRQQLLPIQRTKELPDSNVYRKGGVYVVIGGAGGIGGVWSEYMIRTYQAQIIWIGRRSLSVDIQQKVDRLSTIGPAPLYISADATDTSSLGDAYHEIQKRFGTIHGVVHSAIVLLDQSLANMDMDRFSKALAAKVDISVQMNQVFGQEKLDFVLFFSSMNAFMKAAGQSNYAAGCTFADAYAQHLSLQVPYPVKVMNWGYWGSVGVVASKTNQERMSTMGYASIEPDEAMEALNVLMNSPLGQMALIKTERSLSIGGVEEQEQIHLYSSPSRRTKSLLSQVDQQLSESKITLEGLDEAGETTQKEMEELLAAMLWNQLRIFRENTKGAEFYTEKYSPWLQASSELLNEYTASTGLDFAAFEQSTASMNRLWDQWNAHKVAWLHRGSISAQIKLVETTLQALPEILGGQRLATDVIFPKGSMDLVEQVYKNNVVADAFNHKISDAVLAYVRMRIEREPQAQIRILEVGAGTGGTTTAILQKLEPYMDNIKEYNYTDISKAFLLHAEQQFGQKYPYLSFNLFNVESAVYPQDIHAGEYDIAIAANVLHATPNMRKTIRNVKAMLKMNGVLLLNELHGQSFFTHLTFGLLEGWWKYEDPKNRLTGSPGLSVHTWNRLLAQEGFDSISFPASDMHKWGQQIVMAQSNGRVRQQKESKLNPTRQKIVTSIPNLPSKSSSTLVEGVHQKSSSNEKESLRTKSMHLLLKIIADTLKIPTQQLDPAEPLETYGMDSIIVVQLTNALHPYFANVSSTLFFEYQTIDELTDHFLDTRREELIAILGYRPYQDIEKALEETALDETPYVQPVHPLELEDGYRLQPGQITGRKFLSPQRGMNIAALAAGQTGLPSIKKDIAIIGLAGKYPGIDDTYALWEVLKSGRNQITEIPQVRWDNTHYFDEIKGKRGAIYTKWGGFIEDYDCFDPLFFGISPKEAKQMDPQERKFLEIAYACIEDAGYTPSTLSGSGQVGVFVGAMNGNYPTGPAYWSIANRVSYLFNFHGPSLAVDTACSSSLTAIHLAMESLISGSIDCAIAGGVNLITDPKHYLKLSAMSMLSSGNQCRSFGEGADGFVDAEGVGAVILKPLERAIADGDTVYGVLKGSMLNAGGKTNGYTVPNPQLQSQLILGALKKADVHARTVSYIEAHGTGTSLGDPIEIAGLSMAFAQDTDHQQFCSIGSIKSNLGHGESAAGIAGLTKILLQLRHRQLVPTIHAEVTNPNIDFLNSPFVIQRELQDWKRPIVDIDGQHQEYPRRAGLSSFGAGGANAHLIIEEGDFHQVHLQQTVNSTDEVAILLSARTEEQLNQKASSLYVAINEGRYTESDLRRIAYTLQVGRESMEERVAWIVTSLVDLKVYLQQFVDYGELVQGSFRGQVKPNKEVIAMLSNDDEMQETISKWIQRRKLNKLLNFWVKGLRLDWTMLYLGGNPGRIPLPTYPFARESFWISEADHIQLMTEPLMNAPIAKESQRVETTSEVLNKSYNSIVAHGAFDYASYEALLDQVIRESISVELAAEEMKALSVTTAEDRRMRG